MLSKKKKKSVLVVSSNPILAKESSEVEQRKSLKKELGQEGEKELMLKPRNKNQKRRVSSKDEAGSTERRLISTKVVPNPTPSPLREEGRRSRIRIRSSMLPQKKFVKKNKLHKFARDQREVGGDRESLNQSKLKRL